MMLKLMEDLHICSSLWSDVKHTSCAYLHQSTRVQTSRCSEFEIWHLIRIFKWTGMTLRLRLLETAAFTGIGKNCCVSTALDKQLESIIFLITRVCFHEYEVTCLTVLLGPSHLKGISSGCKDSHQSAHPFSRRN